MNRKKLLHALLFPPLWLMICLTACSTVCLILIFVNGWEQSVFAYVLFAGAFYTLSVLCIFFCTVFPSRYRTLMQTLHSKPLAHRYMTDAVFRTHVSLYLSFAVNLLYVGINLFSFVQSRSMWFAVLAMYYVILAVMRFLLVRYARSNGIGQKSRGEFGRAMLCAGILLTVNFVLSGAVLMILYRDKGFAYPGFLIYAMAGYTFYITIQAIRGLIRYRKTGSPVMKVAKVISLSASLVSMLSLETAMLSAFGQDMAAESKRLLIALTGAGVSVTVIILALHTIIVSARERKQFKE